jgi:hypothetical protein
MSGKSFLRYWYTGAAVAVAVIAAVAAILLAIIATARSIRANALRILGLAEEIVENTRPIWKLADTDAATAQLLGGARAIAQHASEIADALEAPRSRGR